MDGIEPPKDGSSGKDRKGSEDEVTNGAAKDGSPGKNRKRTRRQRRFKVGKKLEWYEDLDADIEQTPPPRPGWASRIIEGLVIAVVGAVLGAALWELWLRAVILGLTGT